MFSPHLYDHKFDIDDIIGVLLGGEARYLNTHEGTLSPTRPEVDDAHCFLLEPLNLTWLETLPHRDDASKLNATELEAVIQKAVHLSDLLPIVYGPTQVGGWLRERAKDEALQWLADHNLIPPSMRHINGVPKATPKAAPSGVKKVIIGS